MKGNVATYPDHIHQFQAHQWSANHIEKIAQNNKWNLEKRTIMKPTEEFTKTSPVYRLDEFTKK